ncbi:ras-2 protein [Lasiosphaeria hispida]|uniref:Ras-2 protein n=1 Tax=Lasiosphaeria hispida TaxID=260671 RepID=A0AAJ0HPA2_9PEZI|nr:ras-2 protein [Lasiosphaeria hispida]
MQTQAETATPIPPVSTRLPAREVPTTSRKVVLYKLVVLGDGNAGKTALVMQLFPKCFVEPYDPTAENLYQKLVHIDDMGCILEVFDTTCQEEYPALQDQCIRANEGFIILYSITSRSSFAQVRSFHRRIHRVNESTRAHSDIPAPIMLVGNNCERTTEREVSTQEGHDMAKELGCGFVEASAKNCINVEKAFYDVVRIIRRQRNQQQRQQHSLSNPTSGPSRYRWLKKSGKR